MLLSLSNSASSFAQFVTVFILFLFVLVVTYFTTRYIAGVQKNKMKTGNMELLETLRLSGNQYLQIVRAGNKYLCMAVSKDSVTMLAELTEEELFFAESNAEIAFDFKGIYEKVKQKQLGDKKQDTNEDK